MHIEWVPGRVRRGVTGAIYTPMTLFTRRKYLTIVSESITVGIIIHVSPIVPNTYKINFIY